jgi:hypothetical protein
MSMLSRVLPLFLVAVALMLFAGLPVSAAQQGQPANTHEGTVVSVAGDKLIMRMKDQKEEHTHTLAPNAKVTCDGRDCKLTDLRPGLKIKVTTKPDDKTTAVKIEALDKNREFEKTGLNK